MDCHDFVCYARHKICLSCQIANSLCHAKKTKIAPVKEMFKHWLETFKASTSISCTSLVTRIATNIGALDGQDVTYISTPRIDIDEHYLMQGHHLKYDDAGNLVFFFPGP